MKKFIRAGLWTIIGLILIGMASAIYVGAIRPLMELGDEVIISVNADDCTGNAILGRTEEVRNQIGHLAAENDYKGISDLVTLNYVFFVPNCTHAKIVSWSGLDRLKQVEITEGDKTGQIGWIPSEWARLQ